MLPGDKESGNIEFSAKNESQRERSFHKFGDLSVEAESLRMLGGDPGYYKTKATLVFRNDNTEKSILVAFKAGSTRIEGSLIGDDDTMGFATRSDVSGIKADYERSARWTEIEPSGAIRITIDYTSEKPPRAAKSFRLQQEIMVTTPEAEKAREFKNHNLFLDIDRLK